jgi:hypothetical protein
MTRPVLGAARRRHRGGGGPGDRAGPGVAYEVAAAADLHGLVLERGGERQYSYLARVHSWSADPGDRTGPEFADPARGEYRLEAAPVRYAWSATAICLDAIPE